jgi:hypothetical protein
LIYILFQTLQHGDQQQHYLLKSICVIGFVLATIGFFQLARWGFNEIPGNVIPYGTLGNRNIFIPAILILMPFIVFLQVCIVMIIDGNILPFFVSC